MKIGRLWPLPLVLALPALALWKLSGSLDYRLIIGCAILASLLGYVALLRDKRKAQRREWRTPEATLHLIELVGGWPGSFAAQRRYRHKTGKGSYQVTFWLIVVLHQIVALDFLLEWKILHAVMEAVNG